MRVYSVQAPNILIVKKFYTLLQLKEFIFFCWSEYKVFANGPEDLGSI